MTGQTPTEVLAVSRRGDSHGDALCDALESAGANVLRTSINDWRRHTFEWSPRAPLRIRANEHDWVVTNRTTVWWRRPGWAETRDLEIDEAELIEAECRAGFTGALRAQQVRWVDEPAAVQTAELKLIQLSVAGSLNIPIPESVVTNDVSVVRALAKQGEVVAKPLSSGPGLAPFTDVVPVDLLEAAREAPVLLQRALNAEADLRVVTVGLEAVAWRRTKADGEPIDWRAADPEGAAFHPTDATHAVCHQAVRIAQTLRLHHSVQDWLEVRGVPFFLEVNPAGNWLFLEHSQDLVMAKLVAFLRAGGR